VVEAQLDLPDLAPRIHQRCAPYASSFKSFAPAPYKRKIRISRDQIKALLNKKFLS
jgi:hypothetical protein